MNLKSKLYLLFIAAAISSCSKQPTPTIGNPIPVPPIVTDVYVIGENSNTSGQGTSVFWKSNNETLLLNQNNSPDQSVANGIALMGSDVYVAGVFSINGFSHAGYWKNGIPVYVNAINSTAFAITISGTDIYIAGSTLNNGKTYACYWKNGIEVDLSDGKTEATGYSIAVNGNDIYVGGEVSTPVVGNQAGKPIATYWKNGQQTTLSVAGIYGSYVKSIAIANNDVYMAGYADATALCWKNGVPMTLDLMNGKYGSSANCIAVSNGDVYVGGTYGNLATYWKNGVINTLNTGATVGSNINAITFQDADMYMAGGIGLKATYWKNNVATTLNDNMYASFATGILIVKH